ncbi:MAG: hypothetical protein M3Z22_03525 [Verrucomicrobiota bacterium]|nr:hypothetical protein [Verrucomicrobiota bacterium]
MTGEDDRPRPLSAFRDEVAIVVSSCDAFFDCWRPFASFFRRYWSDCPFPVYLITNDLRVRSAVLRSLPVGVDRGWASNMQSALLQLCESRVLYFQEDYFLEGAVRHEQLADDFAHAFEHDVDAFCFRARSELEPGFQPINDRFGIVPRDSDGRTRCQVTLWKRESLLHALRAGENAWEMESQGSERTRDMRVVSYHQRAQQPLPYLMSAIVRGLWTHAALGFCQENEVAIASLRGTYTDNSLLRKIRRAQTRRRITRELIRLRGTPLDLDS